MNEEKFTNHELVEVFKEISILNNPFKAPRDIEVSGITQNSATICWKQPAQGGPMREFQIVLSVKDDDSLNKFEYLSLDESQDPEDERNLCKQFTLLEPGVGYEVSVVGKGSPFAYKEQDMFYFKTRENRK